MSSPDEMRSQPAKQSAADAADDDIVVIDEETAIKGPGRGPEVPGRESSSAAAGGASPMTGSGSPMTDGGSPMTGGGSPMAGAAYPHSGGGPGTAPPSATSDGSARPGAAGDTASVPARASRTAPPAPRDDRRWREIQAMFVDDPRDSVQRASDLIDAAIEKFLASIRQRQAALASPWQNRDADTEALRTTLQGYRALWAVVRDMPVADVSGGAAAASAGAGDSSFGAGPGGAAGPHEPQRGGTPT
jgi:hypothetical protein